MYECVICGKITYKKLYRKALVPTYICSKECLIKYWKPLGKHRISLQQTFGKAIEERDYWFD